MAGYRNDRKVVTIATRSLTNYCAWVDPSSLPWFRSNLVFEDRQHNVVRGSDTPVFCGRSRSIGKTDGCKIARPHVGTAGVSFPASSKAKLSEADSPTPPAGARCVRAIHCHAPRSLVSATISLGKLDVPRSGAGGANRERDWCRERATAADQRSSATSPEGAAHPA